MRFKRGRTAAEEIEELEFVNGTRNGQVDGHEMSNMWHYMCTGRVDDKKWLGHVNRRRNNMETGSFELRNTQKRWPGWQRTMRPRSGSADKWPSVRLSICRDNYSVSTKGRMITMCFGMKVDRQRESGQAGHRLGAFKRSGRVYFAVIIIWWLLSCGWTVQFRIPRFTACGRNLNCNCSYYCALVVGVNREQVITNRTILTIEIPSQKRRKVRLTPPAFLFLLWKLKMKRRMVFVN